MKFIEKIQKFMYGRYGIDELYKFMFKIYIFLIILNLFIKSDIFVLLEIILLFLMFYRMLSRKIYRRSNELVKYLSIKKKLLNPFNNIKRNYRDNEYIYKNCKHCKKLLKLPIPYKRGLKTVKCPKCKKTFKMIVFKKIKTKIINKKQSTKKG